MVLERFRVGCLQVSHLPEEVTNPQRCNASTAEPTIAVVYDIRSLRIKPGPNSAEYGIPVEENNIASLERREGDPHECPRHLMECESAENSEHPELREENEPDKTDFEDYCYQGQRLIQKRFQIQSEGGNPAAQLEPSFIHGEFEVFT
jgi:hypothetical protein